MLGPLLFILYMDDLHSSVTGSTLKIFADDVAVYKVVTSVSDCHVLQEDLSSIFCWTAAWQVRLNPGKCEALNITNKRAPIQFDYTINGGVIQWKPFVRYLGIYVNSKLTWSDHCKKIASKATKLLNVLRRTMFGCSILAKDVAYQSIVRPSMEYACAVWSPHTEKDCSLLDAIQNRAARWVLKSRWDPVSLKWTRSSVDCISALNWPSLSTRRTYFIIMFLYSVLYGYLISSIKTYFSPQLRNTRSHKLTFQTISSTINSYRFSLVVNGIFLWNKLPHSILDLGHSASAFKLALRRWLFL